MGAGLAIATETEAAQTIAEFFTHFSGAGEGRKSLKSGKDEELRRREEQRRGQEEEEVVVGLKVLRIDPRWIAGTTLGVTPGCNTDTTDRNELGPEKRGLQQ